MKLSDFDKVQRLTTRLASLESARDATLFGNVNLVVDSSEKKWNVTALTSSLEVRNATQLLLDSNIKACKIMLSTYGVEIDQ